MSPSSPSLIAPPFVLAGSWFAMHWHGESLSEEYSGAGWDLPYHVEVINGSRYGLDQVAEACA